MKVGDYVRTDTLGIWKLEFVRTQAKKYTHHLIKQYKDFTIFRNVEEKRIVKSSPNIIDLIEVGDVLTLKKDDDVYRVIAIPDVENGLDDIFYFAKRYDGKTEDIMIYKNTLEEELLSIVTKEQFESMEYKLGE